MGSDRHTRPGMENSENKLKFTPFNLAVLLAALFIGLGAGALAYRQYKVDRNEASASKKKGKESENLNALAPIVGSEEAAIRATGTTRSSPPRRCGRNSIRTGTTT